MNGTAVAEPEYWPITATFDPSDELRLQILSATEARVKAEAAALDTRAAALDARDAALDARVVAVDAIERRARRARAVCDRHWHLAAVREIANILDGET